MNEIKMFLYSRGTDNKIHENWEISLQRVKYNEFMAMALERALGMSIGWQKLHVDTEQNAYLKMTQIICQNVKQTASKEAVGECPLCGKEDHASVNGSVCTTCGDILDFGYPSFPAFQLEEKEKSMPRELVLAK